MLRGWKWAMLLPLVILLAVSLPSCSFLPKDLNPTPTPLMPAQVAASVVVAIEDHYEDPGCDAQETSVIEGIADALNWPMTFLWQLVAFDGSLLWGLGDAVAGNPPEFPAKFEQILAWLPVHYSGVPPRLDDPSPVQKYGRSWQLPSAEPAAVACQPDSVSTSKWPQRDPSCQPNAMFMSRPYADQLMAEVEQNGWSVTLYQRGNSDRYSFEMVNDRSQVPICIEDRLDYERKMAGLKLKNELQQAGQVPR